jgi:hypothetical protein
MDTPTEASQERAQQMNMRLRRARTLARTGAFVGFASLVYYIALLIRQGGPFPWTSLIFIAILAAASLAALGSGDPYRARRLLLGATAGFVIVGVLGIFTIGLLFLLAVVFTGIGAGLTPAHPEGD